MCSANANNELTFEDIIAGVIEIPGIRIDRSLFLHKCFGNSDEAVRENTVAAGPVKSGYGRKIIKQMAYELISEQMVLSANAAYDGFAVKMPADIIRFYAAALRMVQELVYLYGEADFWQEKNGEKRLAEYCDIMFKGGESFGSLMPVSPTAARRAFNMLPQMGVRFVNELEDANFGYTQNDFAEDWREIIAAYAEIEKEESIYKNKTAKTLNMIKEAKGLYDAGALTEEEFLAIKEKIINKM